jgi:hypothetical protein
LRAIFEKSLEIMISRCGKTARLTTISGVSLVLLQNNINRKIWD